MSKRSVIASFSYPLEKYAIIGEFGKIADREGKSVSELLTLLIEDYVKKHSKGNPAYSLDAFRNKEFVAMPTMGEVPSLAEVKKLEDKEAIVWLKKTRAWHDLMVEDCSKRGFWVREKGGNV